MKTTKNLLKFANKHAGVAAFISVALLVITLLGLSWIATCGIIKLITLCFGWTFSWGVATGIWLVMALARSVFSNNTTVKK